MSVVSNCVKEIRGGETLQIAVRKHAKSSSYTARKLMKIVRWMLTEEWLKNRIGKNYGAHVSSNESEVVLFKATGLKAKLNNLWLVN